MKQFIVMAAMVLLGIFIAGMVFDFQNSAEELSESAISAIDQIQAKAKDFVLP